MRSIRSYQREIQTLKNLVASMQWVQPSYNGAPSCAWCGHMQHHGCADDCEAAKITGHRGTPEY